MTKSRIWISRDTTCDFIGNIEKIVIEVISYHIRISYFTAILIN